MVLIYAADFAPAGPVFEWLSINAILIGINAALVAPFNVWGRQKRLLWVTLTAAAVNLAANLVLLPRYGMWAAVWTTIGAEVVVLALSVVARRDVSPVPVARPVLRVLTPLVMASIVMKWAVDAALLPWPVLLGIAAVIYGVIAACLESRTIGQAVRGTRRERA